MSVLMLWLVSEMKLAQINLFGINHITNKCSNKFVDTLNYEFKFSPESYIWVRHFLVIVGLCRIFFTIIRNSLIFDVLFCVMFFSLSMTITSCIWRSTTLLILRRIGLRSELTFSTNDAYVISYCYLSWIRLYCLLASFFIVYLSLILFKTSNFSNNKKKFTLFIWRIIFSLCSFSLCNNFNFKYFCSK